MSDTTRRTVREPAERPFPYAPRAVPVAVHPDDVAPHGAHCTCRPCRQPDPWQRYADRAMTGWTTH